MAILNASNAVLAKAKSKYGKRLKYEDYKKMLECTSVAEVVSYLKTHTHYKDVLTKINENVVHRGQVELILRQKLFYDFDSLCQYEMSVGSRFSLFIVHGYEIRLIMHFLTLFNSNREEDFILSTPAYFNSHTDIDFQAMSKAKTYDEFLASLSKSPYNKLLSNYKPKSGETPNIPEIEDALYTYMYNELYTAIDKYAHKGEKVELKRMIDNILNYQNFVRILRLKKYYHEKPEFILKHLLPFGSIRGKVLEEMCNAEDSKSVFAIMESTPQGKALSKMKYNYAGEIFDRAKYDVSRGNMYYSTSPAVVMISYVFVTQIELSNIINIIEGARYNISSDKVEDILIYK